MKAAYYFFSKNVSTRKKCFSTKLHTYTYIHIFIFLPLMTYSSLWNKQSSSGRKTLCFQWITMDSILLLFSFAWQFSYNVVAPGGKVYFEYLNIKPDISCGKIWMRNCGKQLLRLELKQWAEWRKGEIIESAGYWTRLSVTASILMLVFWSVMSNEFREMCKGSFCCLILKNTKFVSG